MNKYFCLLVFAVSLSFIYPAAGDDTASSSLEMLPPDEQMNPDEVATSSYPYADPMESTVDDSLNEGKDQPGITSPAGEKYETLGVRISDKGSFKEDEAGKSDAANNAEVYGRITHEEHPIAFRKYFRRWVLTTDDGAKIPLASTLKLMSELKKEGILDERVHATGSWRNSPGDERLRFLSVETIELRPLAVEAEDQDHPEGNTEDSKDVMMPEPDSEQAMASDSEEIPESF